MTSYAALIRGIMPMNPNMRNERLREVFVELCFTDVITVISSGNVLFKTNLKNVEELEKKIEKALTATLGFKSTVIIRSKEELDQIIKKDPFKGKEHDRKSYLIVTFMKTKPYEIFTTLDLTKGASPSFMNDLEKKYGKEITTRTWKTVGRIIAKM